MPLLRIKKYFLRFQLFSVSVLMVFPFLVINMSKELASACEQETRDIFNGLEKFKHSLGCNLKKDVREIKGSLTLNNEICEGTKEQLRGSF